MGALGSPGPVTLTLGAADQGGKAGHGWQGSKGGMEPQVDVWGCRSLLPWRSPTAHPQPLAGHSHGRFHGARGLGERLAKWLNGGWRVGPPGFWVLGHRRGHPGEGVGTHSHLSSSGRGSGLESVRDGSRRGELARRQRGGAAPVASRSHWEGSLCGCLQMPAKARPRGVLRCPEESSLTLPRGAPPAHRPRPTMGSRRRCQLGTFWDPMCLGPWPRLEKDQNVGAHSVHMLPAQSRQPCPAPPLPGLLGLPGAGPPARRRGQGAGASQGKGSVRVAWAAPTLDRGQGLET